LGSVATFTSQPFPVMPSQFAKPALQGPSVHCELTQERAEFGNPGQNALQAPQLLGSVATFTSQPFPVRPSQFANPALQGPSVHWELTQERAEFGNPGQNALQAPQLLGSVAELISQPSALTPLQLRKGARQLPTVQIEAWHAAVPFCTGQQSPAPAQGPEPGGMHGVWHWFPEHSPLQQSPLPTQNPPTGAQQAVWQNPPIQLELQQSPPLEQDEAAGAHDGRQAPVCSEERAPAVAEP
jgi:hypothetical protein